MKSYWLKRVTGMVLLQLLLLGVARSVPVPRFVNDSYVNLGTSATLQIPDGAPFTVEAWVKLDEIRSYALFLSKNAARGSPYTYMFGISGSGSRMTVYTGSNGNPGGGVLLRYTAGDASNRCLVSSGIRL